MSKIIAHINDIHLGEDLPPGVDAKHNWEKVLEDLAHHRFDHIIIGGDIGLAEANDYFFDSLYDYAEQLQLTLGNHDQLEEVRKYFENQQTKHKNELYYKTSLAKYDAYFLDSSSNAISAQQLQWLSESLADASDQMLLFIHHPVFSVNTIMDQKYQLQNRDELQRLLLQSGKSVTVLCGHYHTSDETIVANIRQIVTPAVSYQIKKGTSEIEFDTSYFGYRILYLDDLSITTEQVTFDSK